MDLEILNRTAKLIGERHNWLKDRVNEKGEDFNLRTELEVWHTMKIAELQIKLEELIKVIKEV